LPVITPPRNFDRFWSKVDLDGPLMLGMKTACWQWVAGRNGDGYGQFWLDGAVRKAHRVSFEMHRGPIPDALELDHLCRNRACVNPAHLDPVTGRVNILRGEGTGACNARKTHCPSGHEYTPENTLRYGSGRKCRRCVEEQNLQRAAAA
jgi:hypothetical protein